MQIIDRCRDPYGPLSEARKALLARLLQAPDQRLWERARGLIIRAIPIVTLEVAVKSVSYNLDIDKTPDPFTLYRALHFAVDQEAGVAPATSSGICR